MTGRLKGVREQNAVTAEQANRLVADVPLDQIECIPDHLASAFYLRRLAVQFEPLARKVPFGVRIDVVGGVKRYVREGKA